MVNFGAAAQVLDTATDGRIGADHASRYVTARQLEAHRQTRHVNPLAQPPDRRLVARYGPATCLQNGVMPWRQVGNVTVILTTEPDRFARHRTALRARFGRLRVAMTTQDQLDRYIAAHFSAELVHRAETRVPADQSCRRWNSRAAVVLAVLVCAGLLLCGLLAPTTIFAIFTAYAMGVLALTTLLRVAAAWIGQRDVQQTPPDTAPLQRPVITMLVPLYNETAIADHLLRRLRAVDYPRDRLDICLVLEASDKTTRATVSQTSLPGHIRAIVVPKGTIKTKPRALNYALDFARGSIIGVWDAEDAPAPDQLHIVARHFATSGPRVACLQGTLDYYNAGANWLTRCFTVEYAGWFRVILPGLQRLGLVVPLGGTTLFFRRDVLMELGGWDAHNVTEDADLGVRLARHGYTTSLIPTVTEEEANGRAWPWIKQRSRWLKGYAITYAVHMRNPVRLWRDLGAWRFCGLQLLFLGTLSQFVLAPVLWTFWLLPFGFNHPLQGHIPDWTFWACAGLFITSEIVGLAVAVVGLRKAGKTWLIKWAVTLQFYFPLAVIAAYKGLFELATKPFYWDKTAHGILLPTDRARAATLPPLLLQHPVSDG